MTDKIKLREAVKLLKKDGYWGGNKNVEAFDLVLSTIDRYISGEIVELSDCLDLCKYARLKESK